MVLLVVLLLVSLTLGLSYAAVRSQFTSLQIHRNSGRRISARHVAVTGLTMALKKMHTSDWEGVDSTLTGSLGPYENFQVACTGGDPSLSPGHPDYEELPYRVTLLSTGYAADPDNPASIATYQIRAVVRLVPRECSGEPTDWALMQQFTVYQYKKDSFEVDIPCRLEGPVRIQGKLKIAPHYPNDGGARSRYLRDLGNMRWGGLPDYRPFTGPASLAFHEQDGWQLYVLGSLLGVVTQDMPVMDPASDWSKPESLIQYAIYEGGRVYAIPTIGSTLQDTTLAPDPVENPLGMYYCSSSLTIGNNVTIQGSLFCKDDIKIEGANVHFQPVEALGVYGSDGPVRLPVATCQKFTVRPTAGGSLTGLLAVFDEFEIEKSPETVQFSITGRVVAKKFFIKERQPWETLNWKDHYEDFEDQLDGDDGPIISYFPEWVRIMRGRDPNPQLTIKPDPTPIRYHWHNPGDLIYVPHSSDDGLRWEIVQWTENP